MDVVIYTVIAFILIGIVCRLLFIFGKMELGDLLPGESSQDKSIPQAYWSEYTGADAVSRQPVETRKSS
jgi:hypothetical protein